MKPEREAGMLDKWLENSRNLNPKCGCDNRGGNWYVCSYHEGAIDAWDDAVRAGAEAQRELGQEYVDKCPMCSVGIECQDDYCYKWRKWLFRSAPIEGEREC